MCTRSPSILLAVLFLVLTAAQARAQGLLVVVDPNTQVRLPRPIIIYPPYPVPPRPQSQASVYKIQDLDIQARLVDQVAQVRVSQSFVNTGSTQLEVSFVFPLPYDGAIDSMTLLIDGREYPAKLLPADEARRLYEDIVRKNKDPALLQWMGTGLFKTSVFPVPPGAKRTVTLGYSQLCRKSAGLGDFLFPLSTAQYTAAPVERVGIRLTIESSEEIKNVYSPTHEVSVKRPDSRHAAVTYEAKNTLPTADFRLLWDTGEGRLSTKVLSYRPQTDDDGYFLLLASPQINADDAKPLKKTVIFVVDRSGSMYGEKIRQAREALKFVLNNLGPDDLFNIVAYDNRVETFRPELQRCDAETRRAALAYVEGINSGGSTDIDAALKTAFAQLQNDERPNYVVFLTDGLPTAGETNEMKIAANAQKANRHNARLFAFGVGYDVNSRLIDRLVRDGRGQSEYVRPDENIEARVSSLYRKIQSPVATDVSIEFVFDEKGDGDAKTINRVYPKGRVDLSAGEQLVVVGRYRCGGAAKVLISGKLGGSDADNNKALKLEFPAALAEHSSDDTHAFVEKLWAVRRVGEIIDELDLHGKNDELVDELVRLATKHGILTPYTSFMADEGTDIHNLAENARRAGVRLADLKQAEGYGGFAQRSFKGAMQKAQVANAPAALPMPAADSSAMGYGMMPGMGGGQAMGRGAGMGGGMMGGVAGQSSAPAFAAEAEQDYKTSAQTVRQIGNRAFYRRDNQWIDSTLNAEQQKNPTRIKQFSKEYFALAKRLTPGMSQYLTFDEAVLVKLDGKAYLIEP